MYFGPFVYVLHVQVDEVEPPIWRRVVVKEDTKLPKLSKVLEAPYCGGTYGYERLLESLADPSDPEHDDMIKRVPEVPDREPRPR